MAEAFSEKEIIHIEGDSLRHTQSYATGHDPPNCDYCRFLATITADRKRIEEVRVEGYMEGFNDRLFSGESEFVGQADEMNKQFLETQRKEKFEAGTIKYFRKFFEFRIERLKARIKVLSHWLDSYRLEHGSVPDTVKWEEIIKQRRKWKIEDDNKLIADQTAEIERLKKDAEIKDSLAEGVMTLAEVHEQLEDAKATIERLRGALEPFAPTFDIIENTCWGIFLGGLIRRNFVDARQALDKKE